MGENTIDVAKVMREIRAEVEPGSDTGAGTGDGNAPMADILAPHKIEMERLLLHVEGTRQQAAGCYDIGAAVPGGLRGFVARLVRRVSMFIIRPQTAVNHNVGAAVTGLGEADRELLRAVDTLRVEMMGPGVSLQARLDMMEKHVVPLVHSLSAQNAALAAEIQALQERLESLEANNKEAGL